MISHIACAQIRAGINAWDSRLQRSGLAAVDFFDHVSEEYGVEEEGLPVDDDMEGIEVPPTNIPTAGYH